MVAAARARAGSHAGLQLVVHLVVYPALADAAAPAAVQGAQQSSSTQAARAARAGHERHTRRMSLAVAPVYGLLVVAAGAVLVLDPSLPAALAAGLVVATLAVTALAAVPAHDAALREEDAARLAALHRRLARADLVRLLLALALVAWWCPRPSRRPERASVGRRPGTSQPGAALSWCDRPRRAPACSSSTTSRRSGTC